MYDHIEYSKDCFLFHRYDHVTKINSFKTRIYISLVLYVIGKVGENCDEDRQMPIMYRQECGKAASAIQDSSYLNLTYEGKVEYNNVQFGCIVDEEAKLVWYNEVGVGGETGSQYKGESKFSPICEKGKKAFSCQDIKMGFKALFQSFNCIFLLI